MGRTPVVFALMLNILSTILLVASLLLMFAIFKAILAEQDSVYFTILSTSFDLPIDPALGVTVFSMYALSVLLVWLSQLLCLKTLREILTSIIENQEFLGNLTDEELRTVHSGGLSVYKVGRRVVKTLYPFMLSIGAMIAMLFLNIEITLVVLLVILVYAWIATKIGIAAKNSVVVADDDDEEEDADAPVKSALPFPERVENVTRYYRLKLLGELSGNFTLLVIYASLLAVLIVGDFSKDDLVDIALYLALLKIMHSGMNSMSMVSIFLSRQYQSAKDFSRLLEKFTP